MLALYGNLFIHYLFAPSILGRSISRFGVTWLMSAFLYLPVNGCFLRRWSRNGWIMQKLLCFWDPSMHMGWKKNKNMLGLKLCWKSHIVNLVTLWCSSSLINFRRVHMAGLIEPEIPYCLLSFCQRCLQSAFSAWLLWATFSYLHV